MNELGSRLFEARKFNEAAEILKLIIEINPQAAYAHNNLAECYMAQGDEALAIKHSREALTIDAQNTRALEMLGKLGAQ